MCHLHCITNCSVYIALCVCMICLASAIVNIVLHVCLSLTGEQVSTGEVGAAIQQTVALSEVGIPTLYSIASSIARVVFLLQHCYNKHTQLLVRIMTRMDVNGITYLFTVCI